MSKFKNDFGDRKGGDGRKGFGHSHSAANRPGFVPKPFAQCRPPEPRRLGGQDQSPDEIDEHGHAPAEPRPFVPRAPRPKVDIPAGTPIAHLRSASYGAFIYQRMVGGIEGKVADGDMVAVMDKRGEFFGWGFYNSRSQIALRMFSHSGPLPTDDEIARRISQAVHLRRDILHLEDTTDAYRLIHAEGDGLSGLVADRFGEYVVIELFSLAMFRRLNFIQDAMIDAGLSVRNFVARADKGVAEMEGFKIGTLQDNKARDTVIGENGVKFNVHVGRGHKTGFFCDQRENRLAMTTLTPGRTMLDVCCYTGGFACYAATRGAATKVTAVDLDESALEVAGANAALNSAKIEFQHADAFDFLRQAGAAGKKWDVVVVDPSKFVPRREHMETGLRKYHDLNRLAAAVVQDGGILLTCSCSGLVDQALFVQTVSRAVRSAGRSMQVFRITGAGPDHPFMADAPESAYLKAVWGRLD